MSGLSCRAGIAGIITFFTFAASSLAVPVTYDETINGDLSEPEPYTVFAFDRGANTISGTISTNVTATGTNFDFDSFAFTVPQGMIIYSGSISLVRITGSISEANWGLFAGSLHELMGTFLGQPRVTTSQSYLFQTLGPGPYNMPAFGIQWNGATSSSRYNFVFNVDVPEPASLSILALGIVPMLRRRRSRH